MLARDMSGWVWQGERGMLRSFEGSVAEANASARALAGVVGSASFPEVVGGGAGARPGLAELAAGVEPSESLVRALEADVARPQPRAERRHEITVTYDGED